ncbi:MMPL family transporter [Patulibacter brassicae]|uniref:MMPL family transporter n=1 Tax=Patulibacter brassicae TaxID=1705717 RepID=A0ABU4VP54_9ACTN|nr:MMPL family transporter [Patulibacter brassicae]MDX8153626.1 MMPL family transporter [Patulibacter brassicae]
MSDRWTAFVLTHRRPIAALWVVLTLVGAWAASSLGDRLSTSFDADRPAFDANRAIVAQAGSGGLVPPLVLVAERTGDATAADAERALGRVAAAVDGGRSVVGGPGLSDADRRVAAAVVLPPPGSASPDENPRALAQARAAAAAASGDGTTVRVTGLEALVDDDGGGEGVGLLVEVLLGGLGALVVLALVFGSPLAIVPLVVAAASILTTFLLLRLLVLVTEVSFVVQFLVGLIGLGVAIDYSLLLVVRWREERDRGADGEEAVRRAMRSAGGAIVVSGTTVAIGLLALLAVPVPFIRSIGYGGLLIPLVSVLVVLTLLPGVLAGSGQRLDRRRVGHEREAGRGWTRWSTWVVRRRWPAAVAGLLLVGALAWTATGLRPGQPSVDALSSSGSARTALVQLERAGIGNGVLTPVEAVVGDDRAAAFARQARAVDGVRAVRAPAGAPWRSGPQRLALVLPAADSASDDGRTTLDALRELDDGRSVRIGGVAAQDRDLTDAIYGAFPWMVALIGVLTFALLARALRSILLPLKAVLLNVLSIAAAFGVVVLVWQEGVGSELLGGVPATGAITTWVPLAIFAFLYGLSMDYEVFILTRMREEHDRTGSTEQAVIGGLGRTGRLVTVAALILFLAFVALGAAPSTELRILATGLAAGIILDATVVRALIVPALVVLLGRANWWAPFGSRRVPSD